MKTNKKKSLLSLIMVFSMMFLMLFPTAVFADDAPPVEETAQEETAEPTQEAHTEEPQASDETAEEETQNVEDDADQELPDPQVTVEPEEEDLAEIIQKLNDADLVVVNEAGETVPLASQQAAETLTEDSDPFYFDASLSAWVGYSETGVCAARVNPANCYATSTPVQDAVNGAIAAGAVDIFVVTGDSKVFNEDLTLNTATGGFTLYAIKNAWDAEGAKASGTPTGYATLNSITMSSTAQLLNLFAPIVNINSGASIQAGVDAVTDGGTVNVGPGTYTEQIKINKSVSVIGAGKDATTINPDPTYTHCWGPPCGPGDRALVEINGGDENAAGYTINVLFDGFTLDGQYLYGNKFGVLVHGGAFAEISNNHVKNFYDHAYPGGNQVNVLAGYWGQDWPWSGSAGRWYYTGHAYMHNNIVSGFNTVGMMIWGPNSTGIIDNNEINPDPTDTHLSAGAMGIVLQNSGDATISNNLITNLVTPGGPSGGAYRSGMEAYWPGNTTLFGNTFLNNDYGLATYNNWPQPGQSTFSIEQNIFEGNQVGVQLGGVNISALTGNSFINNSSVGVTNTMQKIVDATGNWWGSATGPSALPATIYSNNGGLGTPTGTGDAISDYLIYDPYLTRDPGSGSGGGGTGGGDAIIDPAIGLPLGLIPVTGGEKVEIPCDSECVTFTLPNGSQAEFCGLCGYSMSLSEESEDTLPFEKPQNITMLLGMTVNLFDEADTLISDLPQGSSLTVSFPMGTKIETLLGIQLWDPNNEEWVSILDTLAVNGMLQASLDWPGTAILVE